MAISDRNRLQLDLRQMTVFMSWSTVCTLVPYSKSADLWRTLVKPFISRIIWRIQQLVLTIVALFRCVFYKIQTLYSTLQKSLFRNSYTYTTSYIKCADTYNNFLLNALGSCDRTSWAKCEEIEKTNKIQQLDVYYQLLSQHVSGITMLVFRRTKTVWLHMVYCAGSAGCGW